MHIAEIFGGFVCDFLAKAQEENAINGMSDNDNNSYAVEDDDDKNTSKGKQM